MTSLFNSGKAARRLVFAGAALGLAAVVSGCSETHESRASQPLSRQMLALMQEKGVTPSSPMLIRAFKKESEFEVWKMRPDGTYVLLKTFPICRWSGQLGPKRREGDRQSPEGFYSITPAMMNPNSAYYLSFNVGYPNAYDRAHGATGSAVMVHGICSSAGCFAMTDAQIADIYALARQSFAGGQRAIQMQAYPFHMTARNLAKYRLDPNMPFWKELEKGDDHFEATKRDVAVAVCNKHYMFGAHVAPGEAIDASAPCPPLKYDATVETKVAALERSENGEVLNFVAEGERAVRLVYKDGAQNPVFARRVAEVSRPEALVPPIEVVLNDPRSRVEARIRKASIKRDQLLVAEGQARSAVFGKASAVSTKAEAAPDLAAPAARRPAPVSTLDRLSAIAGAF
ncbi:murein L,D-transpeptidase [Rhodoblastus acidophilus]|uniref:Murein L,D-transpeptidase n=1 Tax=Candidatus Rhodoblastus alkanivorans TaxID=2954117 RepID=A0ABS9Z2K7_9HYPH|nr:murein L,D-transpeptidase family protein [Candidatus Rhodoblastus alkanivorans]MCI4677550.1 murein L,D-transpeptidase [Candidatus Rhodoblastus alkanivorans]MCI4681909.1 murein L,D-transpeptidase [Candidatus Rhodoblastus alkanivorans]MDI4642959.1 murein L,D-transpeptidase [Rhodoblastus acidophilus]